MQTIETLCVALGLAALAGVNLYLTVFVSSLAIHFGWVNLPPNLHSLEVLGDPWIIGVSGVLYFLEFFADKVPWMDSANDAVHTLIRPFGGALLAVLALGDAHPVVDVVGALLAGGVALSAHTAKSATRLVANASPEPFTNIGLSLGEDALVLGSLGLLIWNPLVAALVVIACLVAVWIVLPKLLRSIQAKVWLAWRKLNGPAVYHEADVTDIRLPSSCELALRRVHATLAPVSLAANCLSGGGPRLPRNYRGWLARFDGPEGRLFFVAPRLWRGPIVVEIPTQGGAWERKPGFLSEHLVLRLQDGAVYSFLFERGHRILADRLAERLRESKIREVPVEALGV